MLKVLEHQQPLAPRWCLRYSMSLLTPSYYHLSSFAPLHIQRPPRRFTSHLLSHLSTQASRYVSTHCPLGLHHKAASTNLSRELHNSGLRLNPLVVDIAFFKQQMIYSSHLYYQITRLKLKSNLKYMRKLKYTKVIAALRLDNYVINLIIANMEKKLSSSSNLHFFDKK